MLSLLRRLAGHSPGGQGKSNQRPNAPQSVEIDGVVSFPFAAHLTQHEGFPIPDWTSINRWLEALHDDVRPQAWEACERAWLLHMRDALGLSLIHISEPTRLL